LNKSKLGHRSLETTERYLGSRQRLVQAVNDHLGIEPPGGSKVTFPAYPEVLPLAGTARKRRNGDIRMAVAMQKLESAESDRMRAGDPEMANSPDSAAQNVIPMYELKWSHAEKTVARRAFDLALGKELEALLQEAKGRAARIEEPSELWDLESWLTERRREIDRRYDYRYSILPLVFAQLLRDDRLTEDDLHGLGQEKLDLIRRASAI
jgi:hypothetical protein